VLSLNMLNTLLNMSKVLNTLLNMLNSTLFAQAVIENTLIRGGVVLYSTCSIVLSLLKLSLRTH